MLSKRSLWLVVALAACNRGTVSGSGSNDASAETSSDMSPSTTAKTTDSGQASSEAEVGGEFVAEPDNWDECDLWAQDCEPGFKCTPWANDGGSSWNALKCSPLHPNPKGVGEPCTVQGNAVSGVDDCDVASMCWDVDPETNMGECVAFCFGSYGDMQCEDPCRVCIGSFGEVTYLCLPVCDPIVQDCEEGQGCYPNYEDFVCANDLSGPDLGVYKDPCYTISACHPGLFCIDGAIVPGCTDDDCCTPFCDTAQPQCPDANLGVECLPWFGDDPVPSACYSQTVGFCGLPQP